MAAKLAACAGRMHRARGEKWTPVFAKKRALMQKKAISFSGSERFRSDPG